MLVNIIRKNSYYDSATLMLLTSKIAPSVGGSGNIAVMMGTAMNKELMRASGLLDETGEQASPNDLVFAVRTENEQAAQEAMNEAVRLLERKNASRAQAAVEDRPAASAEEALERLDQADVAVVSLPGEFAHIEVKRLLKNDVNVLLFSDNVSIDNENMLKDLAIERGLLMMGPDCGTAVINGVGLGFSNKVRRGSVGIVAASGTGMQEVMTLVSNFGGGISQALGTGGRDVKAEVGGKMMLQCLDMLDADPQTEVICIVSKPPAPSVVKKLAERITHTNKPVVACLLGDESNLLGATGCTVTHTLTGAAQACLELSGIQAAIADREDLDEVIASARAKLAPSQKYIRGLYCGGTLSYEAQIIMAESLPPAYSNAPIDHDFALLDAEISREHTVLDLGDDEFTIGRPHPMIEPSLRRERLIKEALDPETAVILADIETGYGSNDEAGAILAEEVAEAQALLSEQGRQVVFFGTICGSFDDHQGYAEQKRILEDSGMVIFDTNEQLVRAAIAVVTK